MGAKKRLRKDPDTEKHFLGRIRVDRVRERTAERVTSNRENAKAKRDLAALERARDRYPADSKKWKDADRQVERFRNANGL
jgi:hypothetical protein